MFASLLALVFLQLAFQPAAVADQAGGRGIQVNGGIGSSLGPLADASPFPSIADLPAPVKDPSGLTSRLRRQSLPSLALLRGGSDTVAPPPTTGLGGIISVTDFGAACNSHGTTGDGTDDTVAIQRAITYVQSIGGTLRLPGKAAMCRVTAPLIITAHLTIDGDYCQPYSDTRAERNTPGAGSWLYFDHAGVGVFVPADGRGGGATGTATGATSSVATTGVVLQNFCTYRNQPAYVRSGSWAPSANDFDIKALQDDTIIRHLMTLNPTKAVLVQGRYIIDDLRGSPYQVGIDSELSADSPRILNVHFWPFSTINEPAEKYKRANLQALVLGRIDNPYIENFATISSRICIHLIQTPSGIPSKIHGVNIDCDLFGNQGLLSEAAGATGQFVNTTFQGADPESGAATTTSVNAIDINAKDNHMAFLNVRFTKVGGVGIIARGAGTWIDLMGLFGEIWGINGTPGTAAIEAAMNATINIGATPLFGPGRSSRTLYAVSGSGAINLAATRSVP